NETAPLAHEYTVFVETVPPASCQAGGYDVYKCQWCEGTTHKNETAPLAHEYTVFVETVPPASCQAGGYDVYKCQWCEETTHKNETAPLDHDYSEFVETVQPASCTVGGYDVYKCQWCEETTHKNETPPLPHLYGQPSWSWSADYTYAAATFSCTRAGCTEDVPGHDLTVTAKSILSQESDDSGSSAAGTKGITYIATVTFNDKTYQGEKAQITGDVQAEEGHGDDDGSAPNGENPVHSPNDTVPQNTVQSTLDAEQLATVQVNKTVKKIALPDAAAGGEGAGQASALAVGKAAKNNISALNAMTILENTQKIVPGLRINSAQDDASGYEISERMREQIRNRDQSAATLGSGKKITFTSSSTLSNVYEDNANPDSAKYLKAATDTCLAIMEDRLAQASDMSAKETTLHEQEAESLKASGKEIKIETAGEGFKTDTMVNQGLERADLSVTSTGNAGSSAEKWTIEITGHKSDGEEKQDSNTAVSGDQGGNTGTEGSEVVDYRELDRQLAEETVKVESFDAKAAKRWSTSSQPTMYVPPDTGETSAPITHKGNNITWLRESGDGTDAWYGFEDKSNYSPTELPDGSVVSVNWISRENEQEYEEKKQLAATNGKGLQSLNLSVKDDSLWMFELNSYKMITEDNGNVTWEKVDKSDFKDQMEVYIELGDDWDIDDINAIWLDNQEQLSAPEIVTKEINGVSKRFAVLMLDHF
ncbi:MAG: hypothetical protein IKN04_17630, partial [Clostridia bacterium]|nr:hypothetical protein [Clostridia bacterium]